MKNTLLAICLFSLSMNQALTATSGEVVETLNRFHENSVSVMNETPVKTPIVGDESMLDYMVSPFGNKPLGLGDIVEIKHEGRATICRVKEGVRVCANDAIGRAGILSNDRYENLVDANPNQVKTLEEIDKRNLLSAELSVQPWSDDYWAIANGILGHRYAHYSGEKNHLWDQAWQKFQDAPTKELIKQGMIHALSPAEKYDLLVGDKNFTLTSAMFKEGKGYFDRSGKVESWMGICHGWAAAAFMLPRPKTAVWVKSADGQYDIPFYPADIKSLGSLLYAKNEYRSKFIGGRCNTKDPQQDSNGRTTDQECFDNNPAAWHFAVVNQIGVNDRSMVLDATYDYEVWNQPVLSYDISYFNPQTRKFVASLKEARVSRRSYKNDKFSTYRDSRTASMVGMQMTVKYIVETSPRQTDRDSAYYDGIKEVTYLYDLELDSAGNVIGGEWYTNLHPDFLWIPVKGAKITTKTDQYLASRGVFDWSVKNVVPVEVSNYVNYASRRGSPLALIVTELFEASAAQK